MRKIAFAVFLCTLVSNASATTETFSYTGTEQTWTVPVGITSATFDLYGAQGGTSFSSQFGLGGLGGRTTATLSVTPGETIEIRVGGRGGTAGGYNGGGPGASAGALGQGGDAQPGAGFYRGGGGYYGGGGGSDHSGGGGGSGYGPGGTVFETGVHGDDGLATVVYDSRLDVATDGSGSGVVTSNPAGIDCETGSAGHTDCSTLYADSSSVTLTANLA